MNTAEILQAKDLRIQVLEEQLTACKSDRKRIKKQLKLHIVSQQRELLIAYEIEASKPYNASEEMVKPKVDRIMKAINCA